MTPPNTTNQPGPAPEDEHWVRTLYERYVQLYGDPIEQPITTKDHDGDATMSRAEIAPEGDPGKDSPAPSSPPHDGTKPDLQHGLFSGNDRNRRPER